MPAPVTSCGTATRRRTSFDEPRTLPENMVKLWIVLEGELDFLMEGEPLVTGTEGDVIQAPNERWHRATPRAAGMATLARDDTP